jgi:hypothetical protein
VAGGHRLEDLKRLYTIGQVQLFSRALAFNREMAKLDQAEAVALGILEAFDPKEGLLQTLRQELQRPGQDRAPDNPIVNPKIMASLFGSVPFKTEGSIGRQ